MMINKQADDGFFARLHAAESAGLNKEWALKVAYCECTLDEALGDMDMDSESEVEFDPNFVMTDDAPISKDDGALQCWLCDGKVVCDCGYWDV